MTDLPPGFENAMEAIGMSGLISFMMSQELAVSLYLSGIAQGRREQAEKCKEAQKRLNTILNPPPGKHEIARMNMGRATGEQDD